MTRTPTRRRYLTAGLAAGVAAVAGCSDVIDEYDQTEEPEETEENETDEEAVENVNHEEPTGDVSIVSPEDGDRVESPFTVEMEVEDFQLEPVQEDDEPENGVGHLHVIVDEGCFDPGYIIPEDEDAYHHLNDGEREIELELESGTHDLCAQAGDGLHQAYALTDEITVEVTGGTEDGDGGNESDDEENGTNVDDDQ